MRRYIIANDTQKQCDICFSYFDQDQLQEIQVVSRTGDFKDCNVCEQCLERRLFQCEQCGYYYYKNVLKHVDGYDYCVQCYSDIFTKCYNCGKTIKEEDANNVQGNDWCQQCYYNNFSYCPSCEQPKTDDQLIQTYDENGEQIYVCKQCLDKYTTQCYNCGDTLDVYDFSYPVIYTRNDEPICNTCFQRKYAICNNCGEIFESYETFLVDGQRLCEDCCVQLGAMPKKHNESIDPQKQDVKLYDYGSKIKVKLKKRLNQQQTNQYIGVQLQLQNDNEDTQETKEFIFKVCKNKKLIVKVDGSLNRLYGVQIVTQPCTYNYHLQTFGWQKVFQLINKYNMTDVSNAGLHFHISKNNFTTDELKSLDYFVNNCTDLLGSIGGRSYTTADPYTKSIPNKRQWGTNDNMGRHQAVNFENKNTVELRFPKATSNYNSFKKRLRMIHNICKLAKTFSFDDIKTLKENDLSYIFTELIKEM